MQRGNKMILILLVLHEVFMHGSSPEWTLQKCFQPMVRASSSIPIWSESSLVVSSSMRYVSSSIRSEDPKLDVWDIRIGPMERRVLFLARFPHGDKLPKPSAGFVKKICLQFSTTCNFKEENEVLRTQMMTTQTYYSMIK